MRFLHTADLHLGKLMNDLPLLSEQEAILQQIAQIACDEKADAVLIAGDVYQRTAPQAEAMALFDSFISRLVQAGKKVFVISGNHDSAPRISYFSALVKSVGVYVTEAFGGEMQHVTLRDADGEITVWMMPFLRPAQVKRALPEEKILSYQDAIRAVLRHAPIDFSGRNLLMCHQFILGCEGGESEETAVGGLDAIDGGLFEGFDYVALGHIHKPQRVLRETMRYAGSPLKYSFSEVQHRKSVTLVDLGEKGDVRLRQVPLYPLHDVRLVEGMMDEVMRMPYSEDYVWITIHDELPPPDARVSLSVNFPNMLKFSVVNSKTKYDLDILATEAIERKTAAELFSDFYRLQNNDRPPDEKHMHVLNKVIRELEEQPYEAH